MSDKREFQCYICGECLVGLHQWNKHHAQPGCRANTGGLTLNGRVLEEVRALATSQAVLLAEITTLKHDVRRAKRHNRKLRQTITEQTNAINELIEELGAETPAVETE
jgi:hypothetical protein